MKITDSPFKVLRDPDAAVKFAEEQTRLLNKIRNDISSQASVRDAFSTQVEKKTKPITELLAKQAPLLEAAIAGEKTLTDDALRDAILAGTVTEAELRQAAQTALAGAKNKPLEVKKRTEIAALLEKLDAGQTLTRKEVVELQKILTPPKIEPLTSTVLEPENEMYNEIYEMIEKFRSTGRPFDDHNIGKYRIKKLIPFIRNTFSGEDAVKARELTDNALMKLIDINIRNPEYLQDPDKDAATIITDNLRGLKHKVPEVEEKKPDIDFISVNKPPFAPAKNGNYKLNIEGEDIFISAHEMEKKRFRFVSKSGEELTDTDTQDIVITGPLRNLLTGAMKNIKGGSSPTIKDIEAFQTIMHKGTEKQYFLYRYLDPESTRFLLAAGIKSPDLVAKDKTKYIKDLRSFKIPDDEIVVHLKKSGLTPNQMNNLWPTTGKHKPNFGSGLFTLGNPGHKMPKPGKRGGAVPPNRCGVTIRGGCQNVPPGRSSGTGQNMVANPMVYYRPQDVANRVGLLAGAIDAGNGAPQIKNELANLLDMMARNKWISHEQYGSAINKYIRV